MKHVLTVVTFLLGALCIAMFLITVRPTPLTAVLPPGKPAHCKMAVYPEPACRSEPG
jgi:hypothetical protein